MKEEDLELEQYALTTAVKSNLTIALAPYALTSAMESKLTAALAPYHETNAKLQSELAKKASLEFLESSLIPYARINNLDAYARITDLELYSKKTDLDTLISQITTDLMKEVEKQVKVAILDFNNTAFENATNSTILKEQLDKLKEEMNK